MRSGQSGLFSETARCLAISDPDEKCVAVAQLWQWFQNGKLLLDTGGAIQKIAAPGRPVKPELVEPGQVPRRRLGSAKGRAALVHAITHIEFNAINLALDAAYRFRGMPEAYYSDWLSVAADEARHFQLLSRRLQELDHAYGDFTAHNGLWEMACS